MLTRPLGIKITRNGLNGPEQVPVPAVSWKEFCTKATADKLAGLVGTNLPGAAVAVVDSDPDELTFSTDRPGEDPRKWAIVGTVPITYTDAQGFTKTDQCTVNEVAGWLENRQSRPAAEDDGNGGQVLKARRVEPGMAECYWGK